MTNLPMPTLQNLLAREGASFAIPSPRQPSQRAGDESHKGGNSDSDSDSAGTQRTRMRVAKGAMPSMSSSSSEDEQPTNIHSPKQTPRPPEDVAILQPPISNFGFFPPPSAQRPIKVIVVADIVCPWCYVALRSIQLAIQDLTLACLGSAQNLPPPRFDIEFRPFFINDNFGSDEIAIDRRAFLESKFGQKLEEHDRIVIERGKTLGIDFKFGGMLRQTTRAHRLLTLAYRTGGSALQLALLEHLFNATHVEEKDIGNVELLAFYADKVGLLPKVTAERWLRTKDLETDVRRLVKISVQGCGIAGVPFVVVNGKWAIGGGEERSVYHKVFEKVWRGSLQ